MFEVGDFVTLRAGYNGHPLYGQTMQITRLGLFPGYTGYMCFYAEGFAQPGPWNPNAFEIAKVGGPW